MEFIIRRTDGDYFDLNFGSYPEVLHPNSVPFQTVEGWGSHRIAVLGCEIAFSDELPGFQVIFEGHTIPQAQAQELVKEILGNIEKATGQHGEVIQTV